MREDSDKYCAILRDVLRCFGAGIIDSLSFTMKHYIKQTDGILSNEKREKWEMAAVKDMVAHNNFAERPFAVVKALARMYPSFSLRNLSHLTHSIVNGTHRCAEALSLDSSAGCERYELKIDYKNGILVVHGHYTWSIYLYV
jgi:hypothetical protein